MHVVLAVEIGRGEALRAPRPGQTRTPKQMSQEVFQANQGPLYPVVRLEEKGLDPLRVGSPSAGSAVGVLAP